MAIWKKLSILLFFSGLLPLMVFGTMAVRRAVEAQYETISRGNALVAARSAEQIGQYVAMLRNVLRALSENINRPGIERDLQEAIIRNYIINFKQFQEISLVNSKGRELITQGTVSGEKGRLRDEAIQASLKGKEALSEVFVTQAMTPAVFMAVPLRRLAGISGALVAQVNLVEMWNLVDSLKIGKNGHAMVVSASGVLIAHGTGPGKSLVLQGKNLKDIEVVRLALSGRQGALEYMDTGGRKVLGSSSPVPGTGWAFVIEHPTSEAYVSARDIARRLGLLILVFLFASLTVGFLVSSGIVLPIRDLMQGAMSIASGDLKARVDVRTRDEIGELGSAFNEMAERLIQLQEDVRLKERTAVFGRIAQGLVHDLKNPLLGMKMALKALERSPDDREYLPIFKKNMEEAVVYINALLDDLRNIYRAPSIELVPLDLDIELDKALEGFLEEARTFGINMTRDGPRERPMIMADTFALKRVIGNIVKNAIEAMPDGGTLRIFNLAGDGKVKVSFIDTGVGMTREKLVTCFTDYMTTKKRKGLGLGLAVCKRLMEEMGGSVSVESQEGKGSTFSLTFPRAGT